MSRSFGFISCTAWHISQLLKAKSIEIRTLLWNNSYSEVFFGVSKILVFVTQLSSFLTQHSIIVPRANVSCAEYTGSMYMGDYLPGNTGCWRHSFFGPASLLGALWYSIVSTSVTKSVTRQIISSKFNKFLLRLMLQSFLYMKNTKQQGFIEIRTSYLNRQCPYVMVSFRGYLFSWFKGKGRC